MMRSTQIKAGSFEGQVAAAKRAQMCYWLEDQVKELLVQLRELKPGNPERRQMLIRELKHKRRQLMAMKTQGQRRRSGGQ